MKWRQTTMLKWNLQVQRHYTLKLHSSFHSSFYTGLNVSRWALWCQRESLEPWVCLSLSELSQLCGVFFLTKSVCAGKARQMFISPDLCFAELLLLAELCLKILYMEVTSTVQMNERGSSIWGEKYRELRQNQNWRGHLHYYPGLDEPCAGFFLHSHEI